MPAINSNFVSSTKFELVFNIPNEEYSKWHERLLEQILSKVEVVGYRPGKAPREKLLAHTDMNRVSKVIFQETVDKYGKTAVEEAVEIIKKEKPEAIIINNNIDQSDSETDDSGFSFKVVTTLLPEVDLSVLDKLEIKRPDDAELGLIAFEEFKKEEISKFLTYFNKYETTAENSQAGSKVIVDLEGSLQGEVLPELGGEMQEIALGHNRYLPEFEKALTGVKGGQEVKFKVTFPKDYFISQVRGQKVDFKGHVKEVKLAKYKTIEDLFADTEVHEVQSQIPDLASFESQLEKSYQNLKLQTSNTKLRENVILQILDAIPDFELPNEDVKRELERISDNTKNIAEKNKITQVEVIRANGIPFKKEPKDDLDVSDILKSYIQNEFKLSIVLNYVYITKVDENSKIKDAELEEIATSMTSSPNEYGLQQGISRDEARREAGERAVRNIALKWIMQKVVKE
jgi:trigger factor